MKEEVRYAGLGAALAVFFVGSGCTFVWGVNKISESINSIKPREQIVQYVPASYNSPAPYTYAAYTNGYSQSNCNRSKCEELEKKASEMNKQRVENKQPILNHYSTIPFPAHSPPSYQETKETSKKAGDAFFNANLFDLAYQEYKKSGDIEGIKKCAPKLEKKLYLNEAFDAYNVLGDKLAAFKVAQKYYKIYNREVYAMMMQQVQQSEMRLQPQMQAQAIQQPAAQPVQQAPVNIYFYPYQPQVQPAQTQPVEQKPKISVNGIMISDKGDSAILNVDNERFVVREGQQVYNFLVKKIEKNSVLIEDRAGNLIGVPVSSR
ncbi:hypothetical protein HZA33_02830 [Candidatus Pacearchaeota archaeon]|nr:hypothetical protein [Candidatus Pacearchaeota archaeon]